MTKSTILPAENQFATIHKDQAGVSTLLEEARQEKMDKLMRLRTLRLEKEMIDRNEAEAAATQKAAAETKKRSHFPKAHRRQG